MAKLKHHALAAALLSTTALTGCGPTPAERELNQYILGQIDTAIADKSWQARTAEGSAIYERLLDHKNYAFLDEYLKEGDKTKAEWNQHYDPLKNAAQKEVDQLRKRLGIKEPITVEVIENDLPTAAISTSTDNNIRNIFLPISNTQLDMFTPAELRSSIAHEVAGHLISDLMDASGKMFPGIELKPIHEEAVKAGVSDSFYREFKADGKAIDVTCDPDAATRRLIKAEVSAREIPITEFRDKFAHNTLEKIGSWDNVHPEWEERIRSMREEAQNACPKGQAHG